MVTKYKENKERKTKFKLKDKKKVQQMKMRNKLYLFYPFRMYSDNDSPQLPFLHSSTYFAFLISYQATVLPSRYTCLLGYSPISLCPFYLQHVL